MAEITPVSSVCDRIRIYCRIGIKDVQPNSRPLIPAEKVRSQTKMPGWRRFFSTSSDTSLKSTSWPLSSSGSWRINGSSTSAIVSSAIDSTAVVKFDLWLWKPSSRGGGGVLISLNVTGDESRAEIQGPRGTSSARLSEAEPRGRTVIMNALLELFADFIPFHV